jgi:outer membrane protein TolC
MGEKRAPMVLARSALGATLAALLCACSATTQPLDAAQRQSLAEDVQRQMFAGQEPIERALTLSDATARAIKYQGEHRLRQMEEAAAAAQIDVARYDLLPKLTASAGYTTRNNEAFGFGFTPAGTIATTPTAAVERQHRTTSLLLAWNVVDFGVSYYRARQISDQKLIATERRRKSVQTLMHDVRVTWWRAEAAERLLPAADRLLVEVDQAIEKTRVIESRKLLPPVQTATLRRALLDLSQQIAYRRTELAQARIDLALLINAPPAGDLPIATVQPDARVVPELTGDVDRLESLALAQRPEMAEEGYRKRITADEARRAIAALMPGVNLEFGFSSDTNKFLLYNSWLTGGLSMAFNVVKLFSLPALNRSQDAQNRVDEARRQAMGIAVLAQTRLAAVRYALAAEEYLIWEQAARDDQLIVQYLGSAEKVGIDTELELIRARARALASEMNRDLAYANVQAAVARLFNSVGYDALPPEDEEKELAELSKLVDLRYSELERASFSPRSSAPRPSVALADVTGASPRVASLLRQGVQRVFSSAEMLTTSSSAADVQLGLQLYLDKPRQGRRAARAVIVARPGPQGATLVREFTTSLSEPIDEEQWRVLGEGAAYRVLGEISGVRVAIPQLRPTEALRVPANDPRAAAIEKGATPDFNGGRLGLRLEQGLPRGNTIERSGE